MGRDPISPRSSTAGGSIGLVTCVAFAVGTMIGGGVFVLSGLAVRRAGPAAIVSFALAGTLVLLSALSCMSAGPISHRSLRTVRARW